MPKICAVGRMSQRTRGLRRSRLALSVSLLAVLPGCLTAELWRGYEWPDVVQEKLIAQQTKTETGTLVPLQHVLENGLWWCAGEDCTSWRWWLRPEFGGGAELAAALLADPDFCTVDAAAIDAVRSYYSDEFDEVVANQAKLELEVRLRSEAVGHAVPAAEISPAAARALANTRRNAYMVAADPGAGLPAVYRDCLERLPAVDLRRLVGAKYAVHAEASVFIDADGEPAFEGDTEGHAVSPAADDEEAPLADRLDTLRDLSLLVRVGKGSDSTILRLRPDRLWLLSGLEVAGDRVVHRSTWHLQAAPVFIEARPAADAPRWQATLRLQENLYQRWVHPVLIDGKFLANVVLTPLTLAFDLVFGPEVGDFLRWITGKGPARSDPQQRRY